MTAASELPATQADSGGNFDCLDVPAPRGVMRARAYLVDRIKRAAIRRLHRSASGECWILLVSLSSEESSECVLMRENWDGRQPPDWLAERINRHLNDELHHAEAFAAALRARGAAVPERRELDWLHRRKIRQWRQLAQRYTPHFGQGVFVPVYAIALCAEQMAMRVLARHCSTLGDAHPLHPLFARVLADETRHVALCADTLRRLVAPAETARLAALLDEVRAIEASFGVSGALAMYCAGWLHSLRSRPPA